MSIVSNYSRMMIVSSNYDFGVNGNPPNEQQVFELVFDPNNGQMVSTGLYTDAQRIQKTNDAYAFFLEQFGVDFANGTPVPTLPGSVVANNFQLVPYASGVAPVTVNHLDFDSAHLGRGVTGKWYAFQFGFACGALSDGSYPGGLHVGEHYGAGDVISYYDYVMLDSDGAAPGPQFKRDTIVCRSPWASKNVVNTQGYTDTLSKLENIDMDGKVGYYFEDYAFQKDMITGDVTGRNRTMFTWFN